MTKAKQPRATGNNRRRTAPTRSLRIAILGAGRLGTALGIALVDAGVEVVAVTCRKRTHARTAAKAIGPTVLALPADRLAELPAADIAIIATTDDAILSAAHSLVKAKHGSFATVLHVSGSLPSTMLRPVFPQRVSVGSMHPLLAISDPRSGASGLKDAFFCLEGEARARKAAALLVQALGAEVIAIQTEHKALYHAAAVLAAGHAVALFALATDLMVRCGPDRAAATRMLVTLFRSATRELDRRSPAEVMTGPFARGDVETLARHLAALTELRGLNALAIYRELGEHAITLARKGGLDPTAVRRLRKQLAAGPET